MNLWLTTLMATAVASDAFTVSLGIGVKSLTITKLGKVSLSVGIFHIIMPLIGLYAGNFLAGHLEEVGEILGGGLLMFIGYRMIKQNLDTDAEGKKIDFTHGTGLLIFSFSVSVDALTAGFTLGLIGASPLLTAVIFGIVALILTGLGLYIGHKLQGLLRGRGELLGGILIMLIGLYFIIF